jgi:hypothetical protein
MATKQKPHKAPAAKTVAPKRAAKEATGEPKREISEIRRLVSRWRWLEADQAYQAATAPTNKDSERLITVHNDEQGEIEERLADLVPDDFYDVCCLLEFATDMVANHVPKQWDIARLRNVRTGLSRAWRNDMEAERAKGIAEARRSVTWAFEANDIAARCRAEKAAAAA